MHPQSVRCVEKRRDIMESNFDVEFSVSLSSVLPVRAHCTPQLVQVELGRKVPIQDADWKICPSKPHNPAHLPFPYPPLLAEHAIATKHLLHAAPCILLCVHAQLLAVRQPLLVVVRKRLHVRVWGQDAVNPCDIGLDTAGHDSDDADAEWCELDAQGI